MRLLRVKFAGNVKLADPSIYLKWNNKIVDYDHGGGYSLEGYHEEGIALFVGEQNEFNDVFVELREDEMEVANLLRETFWERDFYTEDVKVLRSLLQTCEC